MVIPKTRTVNLLNVVLNKIKYEPEVLVKVVNILESEPPFQKQANELVHSYKSKLYYAQGYVQPSSAFRMHLSLLVYYIASLDSISFFLPRLQR